MTKLSNCMQIANIYVTFLGKNLYVFFVWEMKRFVNFGAEKTD